MSGAGSVAEADLLLVGFTLKSAGHHVIAMALA